MSDKGGARRAGRSRLLAARPGGLYRCSSSVVIHAQGDALVASDFALSAQCELTPEGAAVLAAARGWTSMAVLRERLAFMPADRLESCLFKLCDDGLIESTTRAAHPRRQAMEQWRTWSPHAAFFHFGTKNLARVSLEAAAALQRRRLLYEAAPETLKPRRGTARSIRLAPAEETSALARVLLTRRSWRRFADGAISMTELSTLLGLTWGVRRWMHVAGGRRALKTSPSGGACHSIEAYVIAQRVDRLACGVYHYCPDRHALTRVRRDAPRHRVGPLLRQPWFADCAMAVVMTSVWPRVQWKYGSSRSYRSVLVETGHFAQTFELLATSLGLAPFCTGAFEDDAMEKTLGIDGVREGALFVVGAGRRPEGVSWAPWPEPEDTPKTTLPTHLRRNTQR
jgi:SagB-type dehydrogenase family enzyme